MMEVQDWIKLMLRELGVVTDRESLAAKRDVSSREAKMVWIENTAEEVV